MKSIPDDFFDVSPDGWGYTPGRSDFVPVILSKDYLSLYNFGFATSRGMPQVSEEVIGMVPLQLSLSGNGRQQWVNARIVGFSSRLNTIAVPEEFMEWANREFAGTSSEAPSRLIVMLDRPGDPEVENYLEEHDYETAGDRAANGKAAHFLSLVTSIVIAVGLVISLLAFFILLLSILSAPAEKPRENPRADAARLLPLAGGAPLSHYYNMCQPRRARSRSSCHAHRLAQLESVRLSTLGVESSSVWPTVAIGFGLILLITLGNLIAVSRAVRKRFYA